MNTLPPLSGQARRVAQRFALVAAAIELAAPITGLMAGVGMMGVKQCFDDWLERNVPAAKKAGNSANMGKGDFMY